MKGRNNKKLKLTLLILVLVITIGYALLRTGLNINGTANIPKVSWDIYFDNLQATDNSNITPTSVSDPTEANKLTTINYVVDLTNPGDTYEFTVDAVNSGSIDAMVESVSSKLGDVEISSEHNLPAYLDYSITYSDGLPISSSHLLEHNTHETYKVRVAYKKDINPEDLPQNNEELNFSLTITYIQAEDATPVPHSKFIYTKNVYNSSVEGRNSVWLNQTFPSGIERFNSGEATGKNIYLKHKLGENDIVEESYVEFVITDAIKQQLKATHCTDENYSRVAETKAACEAKYDALVEGVYALQGFKGEDLYDSESGECKAEYKDGEDCISPYYEKNVKEMKRAFGTLQNDENVCYYGSSDSYCTLSGLDVGADSPGSVIASDDSCGCNVGGDGDSGCNGS